jgi:hypothetical protein
MFDQSLSKSKDMLRFLPGVVVQMQMSMQGIDDLYMISLYHCFLEHLSCALPTEMIFYLLRSIRSERLIRDYSAELMLDTLENIIEWLQVSVTSTIVTKKNLTTFDKQT